MNSIFSNPDWEFSYVADPILWGKLFNQPCRLNERKLVLSDFFNVQDSMLRTTGGVEKRKLITAKLSFFELKKENQKIIFESLSNFLRRFNRPFRDCLVNIPRHPEVIPRREYCSLDIYYKHPRHAELNERKDMLSLNLAEELFDELHLYIFGKPCHYKKELESFTLNFSLSCFCGFLLQY